MLNWGVIEALSEAFATLHAADGVRVVFLRGGGGTFCAGVDPEWLLAVSAEAKAEARTLLDEIGKMLRLLWDMPAITVALVEGATAGGGAWLASACDVIVASRDATLNFCDRKLDAGPAAISPYVAQALGLEEAERLFATDMNYDALQAQDLGLVQEVAADVAGLEVIARKIADAASGHGVSDGLMDSTIHRIAGARAAAGERPGVGVFLDSARPNWTGE